MREKDGNDTAPGIFTSAFGVNELLLARESGAFPLGQVMGCAVFQITASTTSAISGELKFLTAAFADMQRAALDRLKAEAVALNADAVLGLTIRLRRVPGGDDTGGFAVEFATVGTAVTLGAHLKGRTAPSSPILCTLSARDLGLLRRAGWRPVGLAMGACVHYEIAKPPNLGFRMQNVERSDYVRAMYSARSSAMSRLRNEATALRADGVVGTVVHAHHEFGGVTNNSNDLFVRFSAIGTAIAQMGSAWGKGLSSLEGGSECIVEL